ncbi:molybdopterin-dependent oxidoreductase [Chitinophaga dinghuensis]|uniref:molybdopterin-dependent oxidoreductase n=1 Tax=Chitinophaga dinghuensis TaxID=1539050 RepID=UPI000DBA2AA0|nr:molybdopterin-dependent oxidoreductase [Chitinophaga dinghuensis]
MKKILLSVILLAAGITLRAQTLTVNGLVNKPLQLTAADLSKMPQQTITAADKDGKTHQYSGVPLFEILKAAGVPSGKELHGNNLAKYLLAQASDGYKVVFALPEIDTTFNNRVFLLTTLMDGKPLPAGQGPYRLVVKDEKRPARWIRELTTLTIGEIK